MLLFQLTRDAQVLYEKIVLLSLQNLIVSLSSITSHNCSFCFHAVLS